MICADIRPIGKSPLVTSKSQQRCTLTYPLWFILS